MNTPNHSFIQTQLHKFKANPAAFEQQGDRRRRRRRWHEIITFGGNTGGKQANREAGDNDS